MIWASSINHSNQDPIWPWEYIAKVWELQHYFYCVRAGGATLFLFAKLGRSLGEVCKDILVCSRSEISDPLALCLIIGPWIISLLWVNPSEWSGKGVLQDREAFWNVQTQNEVQLRSLEHSWNNRTWCVPTFCWELILIFPASGCILFHWALNWCFS